MNNDEYAVDQKTPELVLNAQIVQEMIDAETPYETVRMIISEEVFHPDVDVIVINENVAGIDVMKEWYESNYDRECNDAGLLAEKFIDAHVKHDYEQGVEEICVANPWVYKNEPANEYGENSLHFRMYVPGKLLDKLIADRFLKEAIIGWLEHSSLTGWIDDSRYYSEESRFIAIIEFDAYQIQGAANEYQLARTREHDWPWRVKQIFDADHTETRMREIFGF